MSIHLIQNIDPNALSSTANALIEQVNALTITSGGGTVNPAAQYATAFYLSSGAAVAARVSQWS